jgi:hypothetical protein
MAAKPPPYFFAPYEIADAASVQALVRGKASPEQQVRALTWIIHVACATYETSFQPGMADATAFMEGRRFAGEQIVKLTKLSLSTLMKVKPHA